MRLMILRRPSSRNGGSSKVTGWERRGTETNPAQEESLLGAARSCSANASLPRLKVLKSSRRAEERREQEGRG